MQSASTRNKNIVNGMFSVSQSILTSESRVMKRLRAKNPMNFDNTKSILNPSPR